MNDLTRAYFDHLEKCLRCSPFQPCREGRALCDAAMKAITPTWATPVENAKSKETR